MDFSSILIVLGIAASPIAELRAAIPLGIIQHHFPWYYALLIAYIGNLLPVPFILLFLNSISKFLSRIDIFKSFFNWLFNYTERRGRIIERYGPIGLALFVAIPLPVTGAWTGSLVAVLLGLKFKHAFLSICIGVLIAGIIVTSATLFGWTVFNLLNS